MTDQQTTVVLNNNSMSLDALFAGVSAVLGKTLVAPIERIKIILQTQQTIQSLKQADGTRKQYTGFFNCLSSLYRKEGFFALWRGNMMNVLRYAPNQAANFSFNSYFQKAILDDQSKNRQGYRYFLAGGLAGASANFFFYPLDFFKTRMATDLGRGAQRDLGGVVQCFNRIRKNEGLLGLYKGISISLFVVFTYRGIYFGGSSYGKVNFKENLDNKMFKFLYFHFLSVFSGILLHPFDTVRRRLIVQQGRNRVEKEYTGFFNAVHKIYAVEGVRGFFKGVIVNTFRSLSSTLVMFFFDELTIIRNRALR